jgi:predicted RNA-binding Zn-ribbon protein involved in translation (DUF1610 family)
MKLTEQEQIAYLANMIFLAHADSSLSPKEIAAIEEIRSAIGAKKGVLTTATKAVESGQYTPTAVGSFAIKVSNLADMLYLCFVDGDLSEHEKATAIDFCRKVGLTQDQLNLMVREAIANVEQTKLSITCPSCSTNIKGAPKFCPNCGSQLAKDEADGLKNVFEIPASGYAIEFCESTAAGFPAALQFAQSATSFSTCIRNKKNWYLAWWPEDTFLKVLKLAQLLSGIRNRKCYNNGSEVSWDELFGFAWCAGNRDIAYRPVEYCFGKDENRLNPWGCKQARTDWTEWANWFSYGHFRRGGLLKGTNIWIFDKARIRHEVMTNLHKFRYCPYLRENLVDAVLRALPDEVEVTPKGPWKYSQSYEEKPGCIKIVEVERSGGYEFKKEYFADGVRPKGLGLLEEILRKAFTEIRVSDITLAQLIK